MLLFPLRPLPIIHSVVLLGGPGAGKGTAARMLEAMLQLQHLSTGDVFRRLIAENIQPGPQVRDIVQSGKLVADDIVMEVLIRELTTKDPQRGIIFDGCPRTPIQAKALDEHLRAGRWRASCAVLIDIPDNRLIERARLRQTCSNINCQRSFGQSSRPARPGVCDSCGHVLVRRKDDEPEIVQERLYQSRQLIAPLMDHYRSTGRLVELVPNESMNSKDVGMQVVGVMQALLQNSKKLRATM